jgi:hypothetical protein
MLFLTTRGFCDNKIPLKVSQEPKTGPGQKAGLADGKEVGPEIREAKKLNRQHTKISFIISISAKIWVILVIFEPG